MERSGRSSSDASETVIYPGYSFMIARREYLGYCPFRNRSTQNTFSRFSTGQRLLMNNPFGVDIMLSDLISSEI